MQKQHVKFLYVLFCAFVSFDIVLLVYSTEYRDFFGVTENLYGAIWRVIPNIVMLFIYGLAFWKARQGIYYSRAMLWHGVIFILLGFVMCIPWGGYFLAPFSPIGLPYLSSILWVPQGYFLSLAVAIAFIVANVYLIRFSKSGQ